MQGKLILLYGAPSSGKSTLAKRLVEENECAEEYAMHIFSTDDYWIRPDGRYDWNFKLLTEAHAWNQQRVERYLNFVNGLPQCAIVDNTNLKKEFLTPYLLIAKKCNCEVEVLEPQTTWRYDVEELFKRNTHSVPINTIEKMLATRDSFDEICKYVKEFMNEISTTNISSDNGVQREE